MADFQKLVVKNIHKETKDTVAVTFDVPESLHEEFQYKQGQHLNIKKKLTVKIFVVRIHCALVL